MMDGMAHTLDFYWDFSSPFAYLASTQVHALAERTGATLTLRPMLLGALFKTFGTADAPILSWPEVKRRYYFQDICRWAEHWGVPFVMPSRFPMLTVKALRTYLALDDDRKRGFFDRTFRAYWVEDKDIADDATLATLIGDDAPRALAKCNDQSVKDALRDATATAAANGVFGAPTWVVDGEHLFWGQDRLVLVEAALSKT